MLCHEVIDIIGVVGDHSTGRILRKPHGGQLFIPISDTLGMLLSLVADEDLGEVALRSSDLYLVAENPFSLRLKKFCVAGAQKWHSTTPLPCLKAMTASFIGLNPKQAGCLLNIYANQASVVMNKTESSALNLVS